MQAAHQHPRLPVCFTLAMDTTESDTCSKISWACTSSMMAALAGAQRAAMQAHVAASRACRRVTVTSPGLTACSGAELLLSLGAPLHSTEDLFPLWWCKYCTCCNLLSLGRWGRHFISDLDRHASGRMMRKLRTTLMLACWRRLGWTMGSMLTANSATES